MTRVALYTRVSSQEQAREGVSLSEQKERLELWARLEGWDIVEHYTDDGVTGATDNRPDLQRLMFDAKAGIFDLVATTKIDRFMRNTRLLLNYVHELEALGVHFAAQAEGIDTRKSGIGKVILTLLGAVAEWERDRIGERVRDFRSHLAGKGRWSSGRTPFGYRFNKDLKELEIYEPEAEVVRYILNAYVNDSLGIIRLAERLNTERKLTPRWGRRKHNVWTQSAVRHILTHPAYKGGPSDEWQFKCQAIVEPMIWYLAQKRLMTNRHFKPAKSKAEFQGLLRCGLCGHTLRIGYDHNTKRKYECSGRGKRLHLDGSPRCTLPRFDAEELEASLSRQVLEAFRDPKLLAKHIRKTVDQVQQAFDQLEKRAKPLYSQIERINQDMAIADAKLEMRRIDVTTYKTITADLRAKLRQAERQCREIDPMELETLLKQDRVAEKLGQFVLGKIGISLFQAIADRLDDTSDKIEIEDIRSLLESPRELLVKYSMTTFVYPEHIELQGLLPMEILRQSNISPGYRNNNWWAIPLSITLQLPKVGVTQ